MNISLSPSIFMISMSKMLQTNYLQWLSKTNMIIITSMYLYEQTENDHIFTKTPHTRQFSEVISHLYSSIFALYNFMLPKSILHCLLNFFSLTLASK